jgi:hypothetical protein
MRSACAFNRGVLLSGISVNRSRVIFTLLLSKFKALKDS